MDIAKIVKLALPIIFANEGKYGSVNLDDNGAVSIGKVQWHGNRALNLLKDIIAEDIKEAKVFLGDKLYNEVVLSKNWTKRILTSEEGRKVSKLLLTNQGMIAQDKLAENDITAYVKDSMNQGIADGKSLIFMADITNQGGAGASRRICKAAIKKAGNKDKVTLDICYACALVDSVMKKYATRRKVVYDKCVAIDLGDKPKVNPYPVPKGILQKKDKNDYVKWLQWELLQSKVDKVLVGKTIKKLTIDGSFGDITYNAVVVFQKKHNLKAIGIVGLETIRALINEK